MEERSLIERLARHLAARESDAWPALIEDAASILAVMKEPDAAMREAGDAAAWQAMIDAALRLRWSIAPGTQGPEMIDGADEEGEIRLTPAVVRHDHADWVHLHEAEKDRT